MAPQQSLITPNKTSDLDTVLYKVQYTVRWTVVALTNLQ